jgi:parallel beta-helix repeat protein
VAPWKHCAGDTSATGTAKTKTVAPGDTFMFKGGVSYNGTIKCNVSGDSLNRICYDGSGATWGSGKSVMNCIDSFTQAFRSQTSTGHVTIKGFIIKRTKQTYDYRTESAGIFFENGCHDIELSNLSIDSMGYWKNDGLNPSGGNGTPIGYGIKMNTPTECRIINNELQRCGYAAIYLETVNRCTISGNEFHNYIQWGIDMTSGGHNTISGNTFHDMYQYDTGFWTGTIGIEPHVNCIFVRSCSTSVAEKNIFYNNYAFSTNDDRGYAYGGTSFLSMSSLSGSVDGTHKFTIRNNMFLNPHSIATISLGLRTSGIEIYNNLFYCPRTASTAIGNGDADSNVTIYNNIFYTGLICTYQDTLFEKNLKFDNNIYVQTGSASQAFKRTTPTKYYSISEWKARTDIVGLDSKTIVLQNIEDINFDDTTGYPAASGSMRLYLKPGSCAIDTGRDLSESFSNDYLGVSRPKINAWDIGPYEFDNGNPYVQNKNLFKILDDLQSISKICSTKSFKVNYYLAKSSDSLFTTTAIVDSIKGVASGSVDTIDYSKHGQGYYRLLTRTAR